MGEIRQVPIENFITLEGDEILAADVKDSSGKLLAKAGTELTHPLLKSLMKRGIKQLRVRSSKDVAIGLSVAEENKIKREVKKRFEWIDEDPPLMSLQSIVLRVLCTERAGA